MFEHPPIDQSSLAAAALSYARRGWAVLPLWWTKSGRCACGRSECKPGKHPLWKLAPNGVNNASSDPALVEAWWRAYPKANIGLATGRASGRIVLDVDGEVGEASLARLETEHGPLPITVEALTGKGRHIEFEYVAGIPNGVGITDGLDVRSDGGYVVAPPSVHANGTIYAWNLERHPEEVRLAPAPEWLLREMRRPTAPATAVDGKLPPGFRNKALFSIGSGLRGRGMSESEIATVLLAVNKSVNNPALSEIEVRKIAHSTARYEPGAGSVGSVTGSQIFHEPPSEWLPPVPLPGAGDLPEFPVHVLPSWARDWVEAEAEALQVPIDLPGLLVLGVISAVIAKKVVVWITPGWHEPTNVYVVVALKPGEGKSPVFRHAIAPIFAFEKEEAKRLAPLIQEAASRHHVLEARRDKLRRNAANATEADSEREKIEKDLREVDESLAKLKIPVRPRVVCDDITTEALAALMLQHGGRMGIFSSEGGPFEVMAGRYSQGDPVLELFLKSHSGDHVAVDRITRTGGTIHEATLSVVLTVQPTVIAGLAQKEGFRGRGVLARFAYALPLSRVGTRDPQPLWMPKRIAHDYATAVGNLIRIPTTHDDDGEIRGHGLEVESQAREVFFAFKGEIEPQLGPGGELEPLADWANKLPGLVLRLAGILHMADHADEVRVASARSIGPEAMDRAIALGRYLLAHARAAFGLMAADPLVEDAKLVLGFVQRKGLATVTARELLRGMQARFRSAGNLEPVIEILSRHGFLIELQSPYNPEGGRPERRFAINPLPPEGRNDVTELTEPRLGAPPSGVGAGSVSSVIDSEGSQPPEDDPIDADEALREREAIQADGRGVPLADPTTTGRTSELPNPDPYATAGVAVESLQ
jgi:hypothetical protein